MTNADSASAGSATYPGSTATSPGSTTATSVDATAGAAASDLLDLAVDAKTQQDIKALAPLMGRADLTGVDKPPKRASYLTKDAFAVAVRKWIAQVKRRVQAGGGGGKGRSGKGRGGKGRGGTGRGMSTEFETSQNPNFSTSAAVGALLILSSLTLPALTLPPQAPPSSLPALPSLPLPPLPTVRPQSGLRPSPQQGSREAAQSQHRLALPPSPCPPPPSPLADRSLGNTPLLSRDLAKLPNLNTVSRYLTVGLTLDPTTQKLTWDFKRSVDHSWLFETDGNFDQGNCGVCCIP
ncbi:unnamed protein product [Closterium sp. NIES-54]